VVSTDTLEGYHLLKGGEFMDAGAISRELMSVLSGLGGIPQDVVRRTAICVFEAEMNVIIHAVAGSLRYVITADDITVTVTDMGPGIEDIELAMREGYSTAPKWAVEMGWGAGMGLPNIKRNSDRLKIDSVVGEGTTLEIVINIGKGPGAGEGL
jgi:anti-sigma regulatory factor (Ser/Thr protein kinase)